MLISGSTQFLESYKWVPGKRIAGGNTLLDYYDASMSATMIDPESGLVDTADSNASTSDTDLDENAMSGSEDFSNDVSNNDEGPTLSILTRGVKDPLSFMQFMITDDLNSNDDPKLNVDTEFKRPPQDYVPHGIEGRWVGTFANDESPPFECVIQPVTDGKLVGKGRDYADPCKISGLYDDQTGLVSFEADFPGYVPLRFKGSYNNSRDTIGGWWSVITGSSAGIVAVEDPPQTPEQTFAMTRHSSAAFRFRKILDDPTESAPAASTTIAKRRWAFAIEAVRFDVQARMGSWDFMRHRIAERNEWNELHTRVLVLRQIFPVTRGFTTAEQSTHWYRVRNKLHPSIAALYFWINRNLEDRWWWDW